MTLEELREGIYQGDCLVVDVRPDGEFCDGHIPGSSLATYHQAQEEVWVATVASWQSRHGRPLVLVGADQETTGRLRQKLEEKSIVVWPSPDQPLSAWAAHGYYLAHIARLGAAELALQLAEWRVIDVREPHEWASGVIKDAILIALGTVPERADELDSELKYAVICAHGHRSRLAANWLADHGFDVANVVDGMANWTGPVIYP